MCHGETSSIIFFIPSLPLFLFLSSIRIDDNDFKPLPREEESPDTILLNVPARSDKI